MTERQKYQVIREFDGFELRRYEPCVIAEVEMSDDYKSATYGAFRHLFNYISKGNETSKSIAMTAPVIAASEQSTSNPNWKIAFVMPSGSKLKDLPAPTDSRVVLRELPAEEAVAISFRGRANKRLADKMESELRQKAQAANISLKSETRINRFDPPFKPGFLHFNEVVIPTN